MADNAKHNYDESKIKTLSSLEHIRLSTVKDQYPITGSNNCQQVAKNSAGSQDSSWLASNRLFLQTVE